VNGRNIRLFYTLEAILSLIGGMILPVFVIYFRNYGVTLLQVALLAAVFEATIIIFEVPTGIFADRFGRKLSTSIGFFLLALSAVIFVTYRSFTGFLAAEIIFGVSETFISGALEALAADSLPSEENRQSALSRLFSNRTIFKTTAVLTGMISGSLLAGYDLRLLFVPISIIAALGWVVTLFLIEPPVMPAERSIKRASAFSLFRLTIGKGIIPVLFTVGLLSNFIYEPVDQFWQVLFSESKHINISYLGLITAAGSILVMILARFSERLYSRFTFYLCSGLFLIAISLFMTVKFSICPAIAGIIVYFAVKELIQPAISTQLNLHFDGRNRATFLSGFNLICSIGEVIAGILAGVLASHFGVGFLFYSSAIAAVVLAFSYALFKSREASAHFPKQT